MVDTHLLKRAEVSGERTDKAREAVRQFRALQPTLSAYARALTGKPNVRVEMSSSSNGSTDGTRIFYRPPIELGDKTPHERRICDKRDELDQLLCKACRIREHVLVVIYHEIAHIAFGTFEETSEVAKTQAIQRAIKEAGGKYAEQIKRRIEGAPFGARSSYLGLAGLISPFLPVLVNALEDARVNSALFNARKGTRRMFNADTQSIFSEGVEQKDKDGNIVKVMWKDYPLNSQVSVGVFCKAAGYNYQHWFQPVVIQALDDPELTEIISRLDGAVSPAESYELSFHVLDRLRELGFCKSESDPEPEFESPPAQESKESDDEPERGEEDSDSDESRSDDEKDDGGPSAHASEGDASEDSGEPSDSGSESDNDGTEPGEEDSESEDSSSGESGGDESDEGESSSDDGEESQGDVADSDSQEGAGGGSPGNGDGQGGLPEQDSDESDADGGGEDSTEGDSSDLAADGEGSEEPEPGEAQGQGDSSLEDLEPIDTGADEGKGGVELIIPDDMEMGDADDAMGGLLKVEQHDEKPESMEATKDQQAIDVAIIQGLYFETPSREVLGVRENRYGQVSDRSVTPKPNSWEVGERLPNEHALIAGIAGDFDPGEDILGPALLRMRVAFTDNQRGHTRSHLKSGKVNSRVLGKRAPVADPRLFKKRTQPGKRNYFVLIGLDISGSTTGANLVLTKRAAMAQAELCARMGIKFAVVAHSGAYIHRQHWVETQTTLDVYLVKEPDEPWSDSVKNRLRSLAPYEVNLDGHALEYLRKMTDRVTATDKVILYYSDGKMPAENFDEELEILQREIKICANKGYTLLGVGIRTDSPARHGLDTVQVDDDEDLVRVVRHLEKRLISG